MACDHRFALRRYLGTDRLWRARPQCQKCGKTRPRVPDRYVESVLSLPILGRVRRVDTKGRRLKSKRHRPQPTRRRRQYRAYLSSPQWKEKRRKILERDNYTCQACGDNTPWELEVHHLSYDRLGEELDQDLVTLCHDCHSVRHQN